MIAVGLVLIPGPSQADTTATFRLESLERQLKELKETAEFNNQRFAEALATFEQVREEMAKLRGMIEKIGHETKQDKEQRQQGLQEMEYRLTRMEETLVTVAATIKEVAAVKIKQKDKEESVEALLYQQAFSELTQRNYETASRIFSQFVKKYPRSSLADNAQYWIGECSFAMGDFQKAILAFQRGVKKYPAGNKVPAAILKQGYSFFELKSYADAKAFLEKVIHDYPKTPEAIQAREKLKQVEKLIQEVPAGTP